MGIAAADDQFHVLAVDDSLIDRKLIERLLKTSSFQGVCVCVLRFSWFVFIKIWSNGLWFSGMILSEKEVALIVAVTTVDSGSKALEFLGWHGDERNNSNETSVSPQNHHQVGAVLLVVSYYPHPTPPHPQPYSCFLLPNFMSENSIILCFFTGSGSESCYYRLLYA